MNQRFAILFLGTANAARSIMAEALLRSVSRGRFDAYSAGADPLGELDPLAVELLRENGFPVDGLRSKSWTEFSGADAPRYQFVFNLCHRAARRRLPPWPWPVLQANWRVEDPSLTVGSKEVKRRAYWAAFTVLQRRIDLFTSLPLESIDSMNLQSRMIEIGND
jgi:arsenate reductase